MASTHMLALPGCIGLSSSAFPRRYSLFPGNIRLLSGIFASPTGFYTHVGTPWVHWVEQFGIPTSIFVDSGRYSPMRENIRLSIVFHLGSTHMLALPGCIGLSSPAFPRRYSLFAGNSRLLAKLFASPTSSIWVLHTCWHSLGALD